MGAYKSRLGGREARSADDLRVVRLAWAAAFAVLLALAFPFRAGDLQLDLGAVTGWIALAPFALMLRGLQPGAAFKWAAAAATQGQRGGRLPSRQRRRSLATSAAVV